jgi:hypothetical protein
VADPKDKLEAIRREAQKLPAAPRPKLGFGGLPIPPKSPGPPPLPDRYSPAKPPPGQPWKPARPEPELLPVAEAVEEKTRTDGMLEAAPGSVGPPRSYSPPPFASPQEEQAIEREAESRGDRLERPRRAFSPVPFETHVVRHEYGVDKGTRAWLVAIVTALAGTAGTAIYGAVRDPSPPAVQEAPKRVDDQERELRRIRGDLNECRSDLREVQGKQDRHDDRIDSLERKFYDLDKRTPKVNP